MMVVRKLTILRELRFLVKVSASHMLFQEKLFAVISSRELHNGTL